MNTLASSSFFLPILIVLTEFGVKITDEIIKSARSCSLTSGSGCSLYEADLYTIKEAQSEKESTAGPITGEPGTNELLNEDWLSKAITSLSQMQKAKQLSRDDLDKVVDYIEKIKENIELQELKRAQKEIQG